jgi:hypothetical protein
VFKELLRNNSSEFGIKDDDIRIKLNTMDIASTEVKLGKSFIIGEGRRIYKCPLKSYEQKPDEDRVKDIEFINEDQINRMIQPKSLLPILENHMSSGKRKRGRPSASEK